MGFTSWAIAIGGYTNFISSVAVALLASYQGFALEKSMIKKLYYI